MEPVPPSEPADAADAAPSVDIRRHMELMQEYRTAIRIVTELFEGLEENARLRMQHNPVHTVKSRLKSPTSIIEKLRRKGLPVSDENIRRWVRDVAGVRVVCNYLNDVDAVEQALLGADGVELLARKDYVERPKESGYRSLHLVVSVPVVLNDMRRAVPVEVQVRTIAMDFWASLEHQLRYKNRAVLDANGPLVEDIRARLNGCAAQIAELDRAMQRLQQDIDALKAEQEEALSRPAQG